MPMSSADVWFVPDALSAAGVAVVVGGGCGVDALVGIRSRGLDELDACVVACLTAGRLTDQATHD